MPNRSGSSAVQRAAPVEERELRAAHEIARAFLAASHPHEVYRLALTRLAPVVHADFAAVFLRDDDDPDALRPVVVHGWPQSSAIYLGQLRIRAGRGPTGTAVASNRTVEVENVFADAQLGEWWEPARELGFAAMISLPLCNEYGAIGAVSFYFAAARVFSDEERRLLQLIAEQLAATAARINVVGSLRAANHRLQRENETLTREVDRLRALVRAQAELVVDVGNDLGRTIRAFGDARAADPALSRHAAERIVADLITLCSLRLGRVRAELSPEDATRLARVAIDDAQPFIGIRIALENDEMVVPVTTDGTAVVRILSALALSMAQPTSRGSASLRVERAADEVVWTLRVAGMGLEPASPSRETASRAGSSLDLALARERAAWLGGSIEFTSEPGAGRSCSLRLPAHSARH